MGTAEKPAWGTVVGPPAAVRDRRGPEVFRPEALPMGPEPVEGIRHPSVQAFVGLRREAKVAVAAALRAAGADPTAIAQALGVTAGTVRDYLAAAREWGALDDVVRDIECRLVPQAVENLAQLLAAGDKQVTLELLKGRGLLRRHTTGPPGPGATPEVNLTVVFTGAPSEPAAVAVGSGATAAAGGEIVGTPTTR